MKLNDKFSAIKRKLREGDVLGKRDPTITGLESTIFKRIKKIPRYLIRAICFYASDTPLYKIRL